jgi:2'-5' RNA ligase
MGRLRIRTFIALPIEAPIRRRLNALQAEFGEADEAIKWVGQENLHVTLLFLGEVDDRELVNVCRAVKGVAEGFPSFPIEIGHVGGFPNLRRPRTLWVGIEEGKDEAIRLHDQIEDALIRQGAYRREEREFTPHVTLGRVRSGEVTPALAAKLTQESGWTGGRQRTTEVHVMGSELGPEGPTYTILSREKLRGAGEPVE